MDWKTLVAILSIFLGGGSVATVLLNHLLKTRERLREETVELYAGGLLDRINDALTHIFDEVRHERGTRLDLDGYLHDALRDRMREVSGMERLSGLPHGFHRLPPICFSLLERYAVCRLGMRDRRRRGEDATDLVLACQEIEDMVDQLRGILMDASSRIRSLGAWGPCGMASRLRKDGTLTRLGTRLLEMEESLESLEVREAEGVTAPVAAKVACLVAESERLRAEGINLVASENRLSMAARMALASDLSGRYVATGYGGSRFAAQVVEATEELAREVFAAEHALISPISGNMCVLAVLFAFTSPGDAVATIPFSSGGYPFGVEKFHRRRVWIPTDSNTLDVDVEKTVEVLVREGVRVAFLGASFLLFPQPVAAIRRGLEKTGHGCLLAYDASHVLGLIACGEFQDPLREGAHVLMGSTHKTMFGPQGGVILVNDRALEVTLRRFLELDLEEGIALVDNPHVNRIAALGIALEELLADRDYGRRVVENARSLAASLHERGLPVRFSERGFTASHQVLLHLEGKEAAKLCRSLEEKGIFIDAWGRLGTAEVTHLGMGPGEMDTIARWMVDIYRGRARDDLSSEVRELAARFAPT
ncbi:MAG: hypothetical protein H5T73_10905 [Actinobacteria bacterium]|nr:hypothetical protein [Actinomycetota bacterium]